MRKHTKGPWSYVFHDGSFYIHGANGGMVACDPMSDATAGSIGMVRGVGRGASLEEQEANAALMARAPEMADRIAELEADRNYWRASYEAANARIIRALEGSAELAGAALEEIAALKRELDQKRETR